MKKNNEKMLEYELLRSYYNIFFFCHYPPQRMYTQYDAIAPDLIIAYIGSSISLTSFEVGVEV